MISDILQRIVDVCYLDSQINLLKINKSTNNNTYIFKLTVPPAASQRTILQHKFSKLKVLDCSKNNIITDVNHLSGTLRELYCGYRSSIDQNGISELKELEYLNCSFNKNITSINHVNIWFVHSQFSGIDK